MMASDQESKEQGQQESNRSFIRETRELIQEAFRMSPKPMKASFRSYISDGTTTSSSSAHSEVPSNDSIFNRTGGSDGGFDEDEEWTMLADGSCMSNLNERSDSYETLDVMNDMKDTRRGKRESMTRCARSNSYSMGLENPITVEDGINSNLLSPTTTFTSLRMGEMLVLKPIHAVQRYSLSSRRTKGSIGQLILTNSRLKFLNYSDEGKCCNLYMNQFPPFDFHSFLDESLPGSITEFDEDIDLMMIFSIKSGPLNNIMSSTTMNTSTLPLPSSAVHSSSHLILRIDCNDFRCVEFLLKSNEESRILIETLEKLFHKQFATQVSISSSNNNPSSENVPVYVPLLWTLLWTKYGNQFEGGSNRGKCSNCITRLNLDMFPATKDVLSFDQVESIYSRITESCHTYSSTRTFISSMGKWMKIVSKIMKIVHQIVHHLTSVDTRPFHGDQVEIESESLDVLLLKPIIISLVQIVLCPKSRTLVGLERLIFKQFVLDSSKPSFSTFSNLRIYRTNSCDGGSVTKSSESIKSISLRKRYPSHVIFTLFVDCLNQILTLNNFNFTQFEFNSLFLIRIFDLQFIPSTPSSNVTWTCYDSFDDTSQSVSGSATSKLTMSASKINSFINNTLSGKSNTLSANQMPQNYKPIEEDSELVQSNRFSKPNQSHSVTNQRDSVTNQGNSVTNQRNSVTSPLHGLGCVYKESSYRENSIPVSFAAIGTSIQSLLFLKNPFYCQEEVDLKLRSGLKSLIPQIPTSVTQINLFEGLFLRWHFAGKCLVSRKPFHTISPKTVLMDQKTRTASHVSYYHRFAPQVQVMAFDHILFDSSITNSSGLEESYQETTL